MPAARRAPSPAKKTRKPMVLTTNRSFRGPGRRENLNYREGRHEVNLNVHGASTKVSATYLLGKRRIKLR